MKALAEALQAFAPHDRGAFRLWTGRGRHSLRRFSASMICVQTLSDYLLRRSPAIHLRRTWRAVR